MLHIPFNFLLKNLLLLSILLSSGFLAAQSAVSSNLMISRASPYLEDYAEPGRSLLTLISTDQRDNLMVWVEIEVIAGGQSFLLRPDMGTVPPINLVRNVPTILTGADLTPYFSINAMDPALRQDFVNNGGRLPEGRVEIQVRTFDLITMSGEQLNSDGYWSGFVRVNPPPVLVPFTGMDVYNDQVPAYNPQLANFQWQHFPPAGGVMEYIVEIWDNSMNLGFGNQFTIDNLAPLMQSRILSSSPFPVGPTEPELIPGREYLWRVNVSDRTGIHRFDNAGNSEIGRFLYGAENTLDCYAPSVLLGSGGDGVSPFALSWRATGIATQNIHRLTIFNAQTEELVNMEQYGPGTYSFLDGAGFRLTQEQGLLDTAVFPLRAELCVLCPDGSSNCESIVYGTVVDPDAENPCPPANNVDWVLVDASTVFVNWQPGDPTLPHRATIIDVADERPINTGNGGLGGLGQAGTGDIGMGFGGTGIGDLEGGNQPLPPNEMTFSDLEGGHDYHVEVCSPCAEEPSGQSCRDMYFTMPDVADCQLTLIANLDEITPATAEISWTVNTEWTDRISVHLNNDSFALDASQTTYAFANLTEGEDYDAQVCAYCPGTQGGRLCRVLSFTAPVYRCAETVDLENYVTAAATTTGGILVNWTDLPTEIQRENTRLQLLNPATREVQMTATIEPDATTYTFTGLTEGESYLVNFCMDCALDVTVEPLCIEREVMMVNCDGLDIVGLNVADLGARHAELFWNNPDGLTTDTYFIRYRKDNDLEPFSENFISTTTSYRLEDLVQKTAYDVQVCYTCETEADRCVTTTFTTEGITCANAGEHPLEYSCGVDGEIIVDNTIPLMESLSMGDSVWAGDFLVVMDEINENTPFTGTGRMVVPYLNEAILKVEFDRIKVSQGCRLVEGSMKVVSPYQELLETANDFISNFNNDLNQIQAGLDQIINLVQSVNDWANDWLLVNTAVSDIIAAAALNPWIDPAVIAQLSAAQAAVETCMAQATTEAEREACRQQLVDAIETYQDALDELYNADFQVPFVANPEMVYGYDIQDYPEMNQLGWYGEVADINERPYRMAWKSLKRGGSDLINATRDPNGPLEGIKFMDVDSNEVSYAPVGDTDDVSMTVDASEGGTIYAIQQSTNADGGTSSKIAGQLALIEYDELPIEIIFVPVNNVSMAGITQPELQASLDAIFQQAVVKPSVVLAQQLVVDDVPDVIPARASGVRSYQQEFRKIIQANEDRAATNYGEGTYFIYLVQDYATDEEGKDRTGFMPRQSEDGFVFVDNIQGASSYPAGLSLGEKIARTAAHELGHGAYHLQHIWEELPVPQETAPDNLMSYQGGKRLHKWQWDLMHDPVRVGFGGVFEGDEDGEYTSILYLDVIKDLRNESGVIDGFSDDDSFTFLSPAGLPITIPAHASNVVFFTGDAMNGASGIPGYDQFDIYPFGTLFSFTIYGERTFVPGYNTSDYATPIFMKYVDTLGAAIAGDYIDSLTYNLIEERGLNKVIVAFPCYRGNETVTHSVGLIDAAPFIGDGEYITSTGYAAGRKAREYDFLLQYADSMSNVITLFDVPVFPAYTEEAFKFLEHAEVKNECTSPLSLYAFIHAHQISAYPYFYDDCTDFLVPDLSGLIEKYKSTITDRVAAYSMSSPATTIVTPVTPERRSSAKETLLKEEVKHWKQLNTSVYQLASNIAGGDATINAYIDGIEEPYTPAQARGLLEELRRNSAILPDCAFSRMTWDDRKKTLDILNELELTENIFKFGWLMSIGEEEENFYTLLVRTTPERDFPELIEYYKDFKNGVPTYDLYFQVADKLFDSIFGFDNDEHGYDSFVTAISNAIQVSNPQNEYFGPIFIEQGTYQERTFEFGGGQIEIDGVVTTQMPVINISYFSALSSCRNNYSANNFPAEDRVQLLAQNFTYIQEEANSNNLCHLAYPDGYIPFARANYNLKASPFTQIPVFLGDGLRVTDVSGASILYRGYYVLPVCYVKLLMRRLAESRSAIAVTATMTAISIALTSVGGPVTIPLIIDLIDIGIGLADVFVFAPEGDRLKFTGETNVLSDGVIQGWGKFNEKYTLFSYVYLLKGIGESIVINLSDLPEALRKIRGDDVNNTGKINEATDFALRNLNYTKQLMIIGGASITSDAYRAISAQIILIKLARYNHRLLDDFPVRINIENSNLVYTAGGADHVIGQMILDGDEYILVPNTGLNQGSTYTETFPLYNAVMKDVRPASSSSRYYGRMDIVAQNGSYYLKYDVGINSVANQTGRKLLDLTDELIPHAQEISRVFSRMDDELALQFINFSTNQKIQFANDFDAFTDDLLEGYLDVQNSVDLWKNIQGKPGIEFYRLEPAQKISFARSFKEYDLDMFTEFDDLNGFSLWQYIEDTDQRFTFPTLSTTEQLSFFREFQNVSIIPPANGNLGMEDYFSFGSFINKWKVIKRSNNYDSYFNLDEAWKKEFYAEFGRMSVSDFQRLTNADNTILTWKILFRQEFQPFYQGMSTSRKISMIKSFRNANLSEITSFFNTYNGYTLWAQIQVSSPNAWSGFDNLDGNLKVLIAESFESLTPALMRDYFRVPNSIPFWETLESTATARIDFNNLTPVQKVRIADAFRNTDLPSLQNYFEEINAVTVWDKADNSVNRIDFENLPAAGKKDLAQSLSGFTNSQLDEFFETQGAVALYQKVNQSPSPPSTALDDFNALSAENKVEFVKKYGDDNPVDINYFVATEGSLKMFGRTRNSTILSVEFDALPTPDQVKFVEDFRSVSPTDFGKLESNPKYTKAWNNSQKANVARTVRTNFDNLEFLMAPPVKTKASIAPLNGFDNNVNDLVAGQGITLDEFIILEGKAVGDLTAAEELIVRNIRNAIPDLDASTIIQKVIPESGIIGYIKPVSPYNQVGGFLSTAKDSKHLSTFDEIYYGMRLDYTPSDFSPTDRSYGVLRYTTPDLSSAIVPRPPAEVSPFPFTGHGFTSGTNGNLGVPEWKTGYLTPDNGAELYQVMADGTEVLIARYLREADRFIPVP